MRLPTLIVDYFHEYDEYNVLILPVVGLCKTSWIKADSAEEAAQLMAEQHDVTDFVTKIRGRAP